DLREEAGATAGPAAAMVQVAQRGQAVVDDVAARHPAQRGDEGDPAGRGARRGVRGPLARARVTIVELVGEVGQLPHGRRGCEITTTSHPTVLTSSSGFTV